MHKPEDHKNFPGLAAADIRMEIILADLIGNGLSLEDVVFVSNSLFKRNYHFDIEEIRETEYEITRKKKISFIINREGIYDQLPEDLFHQPADGLQAIDHAASIREIKTQENAESQSRLFFLPIEQEFYRHRVMLETAERQFLFQTNNALPGEIFDRLWRFPSILDGLQKTKLGVLMPVLHKISGNLPLAAAVIESITGDTISIEQRPPAQWDILSQPALAEMRLGDTTVLGGRLSDQQSSLVLTIFVSSTQEGADYLPGGRRLAIHQFLSNLVMPLEAEIIIETDFSATEAFFVLEKDSGFSGRLNYTTTI